MGGGELGREVGDDHLSAQGVGGIGWVRPDGGHQAVVAEGAVVGSEAEFALAPGLQAAGRIVPAGPLGGVVGAGRPVPSSSPLR